MNIDDLKNAGVEIRRFCGVPVDKIDENHYVACDKEAVGELVAHLEDGQQVPVPVCQQHLEEITRDFRVEEVDNTGAILLD